MFRRHPLSNWRRQTLACPEARLTRFVARRQYSQAPQSSRVDRITSKLPKKLQKYTSGLRDAPVSHIVSFLILHELTAIVPLVVLFTLFHYTTCAPISYMTEHFGDYVNGGISRFERYFRRKVWFGFGTEGPAECKEQPTGTVEKSHTDEVLDRWKKGDRKYEILMEVALAYAVTKALLPIRIIGSMWATPWFAGVLVKMRRLVTRKQ